VIVRGGSVLTGEGWRVADVHVEGDHVIAVGDGPAPNQVLDARGCLVGPAFVDLHTHLREPGQTWKEDIESGSRAAVAGGYGAIVAMPNTEPPMDTPKVIETVTCRAAEIGIVDVVPAAALTVGRSGTAAVDMTALYESGVRIFSDDGDSVADEDVMRGLMQMIADLPGSVLAQHAEDRAIAGGGQMHEGEMSRRLGVAGLPQEAESSIVARDVELALATGARYHVQHVSSVQTLHVITEARSRGVRVTCEVTPHHLTFDDTHLASLDTNFKMYPPLRSPEDRSALVKALQRGMIDAVATDHAPHGTDEKHVAFADAPRGVIGLETAASATWEVLGSPEAFFEVLSGAPARIAGLGSHGRPVIAGGPANLVVFDPMTTWTASRFASKSENSPYLGREMRGAVRYTIHRGTVVYERGGQG
jgi:dihydroorotase